MTGVVAAVDVGSNSVRLLVLDAQGQRVLREIVTTRLAQGVDATGHLDDEAIARTVRVIEGFRAIWEANGVATDATDVRIIATSAVRDAVDRDRFLVAVKAAVGLDIDVLGGHEEAALAFAGATGAVAAPAPSVVIDVGGGSTELVVGDVDGSLVGSVSLQLGCVRLTERDLHSDPVTTAELVRARTTIDVIVAAGLAELERQGVALDGLRGAVGVAGTATTLAALHLGLDDYEESRIHGAIVPGDALTSLAAELADMDVSTRAALGPVQPGRAEVLHGGALVLSRTLELLGIDALYVSESDSLDAVAAGLLTGRRTR
jgi:exopolyphosphatase/guanosine-5'-triphosphate,3'-diphosphate pyrophosphatase